MASVYSRRFYAVHDLDGTGPDLGPPPGEVWIVRDIDVVNGELLNNVLWLGSAGQVIWANSFGGTIAFDFASFRGRQVFEPGDTFHFHTTAPLDITASGYALTLP